MTFEYEMDGRTRRYTPDFYLPDFDMYLEVKGFWWGQDKRKMDAVREKHPAVNFTLIQKNELQRLRDGDICFFAQTRHPAEARDERLDAELAHS